jgi:hypothetical protein
MAAGIGLGPLCARGFAQGEQAGRIGEKQVFAELAEQDRIRSDALIEYAATRVYRVSDPSGKIHAQEEGRMEFHAPDRKTFVVTSEQGSGIVRRLALNPLIAGEINAAAGKDRRDSAISSANYQVEWIGEEDVRGYHCYVLRALPKRADKYLFEGRVWIDRQDFAVVRIEGHPAGNLSFWIKRADFVREYQKIGGFWLPLKDETVVQVRFYGKKVLTIDHGDYLVRGTSTRQACGQPGDTTGMRSSRSGD